MAQEQIQLEFMEEMQEMQMIQQQIAPMMQNPMMMQQIHRQCRVHNVFNR